MGFRKGLDIYLDNGNVCSRIGWRQRYKGTAGAQLLPELGTGGEVCQPPGKQHQQTRAATGRKEMSEAGSHPPGVVHFA